jgi:uroporphyrinogen III methyltransferase/synthase
VRNFVDAAGAEVLAGVKVASIGPVTSETARELGVEVTVEAAKFTIDGLVEAIRSH